MDISFRRQKMRTKMLNNNEKNTAKLNETF